MAPWADYSGGRPSGAALRAAGFVGVLRYVGIGGPEKRITASEYRDLRGAGLDVLLVAEQWTTDAWGGYAAGLANARAALNDARALGIPDTIGIAAAADAHAANAGQIAAAVEYVRAFRDVLGVGRTGFYGFVETSNAVRAAGVASWHWRCGSYPDAAARTWVHFWQRNSGLTTTPVSGVTCDINDQLNPLPTQGVPDMSFDQPDRDALNAIKAVVATRYPSLVDGTLSYDTGEFVRFVDAATNAISKRLDTLATPVAPSIDLDALAAKVAAKLGTTIADQVADKLAARLVS